MITEEQRQYHKDWYEKNKSRRLVQCATWYRSVMSDPKSARRFKDIKNGYQRKKYHNNPNWRERNRLKKILSRLISGRNSDEQCWKLCGCTKDQLRRHLEAQFDRGMSWDNYGKNGWVADHKRPCCKFNLLEKNQREACFHFSNLQPMWYDQNRQKSITDVTA